MCFSGITALCLHTCLRSLRISGVARIGEALIPCGPVELLGETGTKARDRHPVVF
jgi:hypothetical protein